MRYNINMNDDDRRVNLTMTIRLGRLKGLDEYANSVGLSRSQAADQLLEAGLKEKTRPRKATSGNAA